MTQNIASSFTCQIEITMLGEVHWSGLVSCGLVFDHEFIIVREGVGDLRLQIPGVAFFAIFAGICEDNSACTLALEWRCMPQLLVETSESAVQRIWTIVLCQVILDFVEGECSTTYSIGIASDYRAKIRLVSEIPIEVVKTQHNVGESICLVRHAERNNDRAIIHRPDLKAMRICDGVYVDRLSIAGSSEASPVTHASPRSLLCTCDSLNDAYGNAQATK